MDPLIDFLRVGLDGAMKRHEAITDNIANVDTPGYKRKDVDFMETLQTKLNLQRKNQLALKVTNERHLNAQTGQAQSSSSFKKVAMEQTRFRNDGNSVDIELEMTELAKNNLYYNTLVQRVSGKFKMLKNVIDKGGR